MAARTFPPSSKWGRPGFIDILQEIAKVWRADRDKVTMSADSLTDKLRSVERTAASANVPDVAALESTVNQFRHAFDMRNGGFGDAPKFPRPSELLFLLREHVRTGHQDPLAMVLRTLQAMALGGMRDHIGGGFHRYSVDAGWRVPHFEKMLYDQAQLVLAYVEAAQASGGDPFYLEVAEDTLLYVLREMTDADGGFYSAEDADSVPPEQAGQADAHKTEGAFYLWRRDELEPLLGANAAIVASRFGIEPNGNAPSDPQQEFTGKNLLYVSQSIEDIAARTGKSADGVSETIDRARVTMFQHRLTRPRPQRDDKILTAWNGLMIGAFARTARALQVADGGGAAAAEPYLQAARRAATFFHERMWVPDSRRLLRRYRQGDASIDAYAEDYASLIFGVLELFQADTDPKWLEWAITLQRRQDELFWDEAGAGWFSTTGRDPSVLLRMKEDYDGAEPSASSLSVANLLVLSHLVDDPSVGGANRADVQGVGCGPVADGPRRADDGRRAVSLSCRSAADRHRRRSATGDCGSWRRDGRARARDGSAVHAVRDPATPVQQHGQRRARALGPPAAVCRGHGARRRQDGGLRVQGPDLPCAGDHGRRTRRGASGMSIPVDIWLRGTDFATTGTIEGVTRAPKAWTDDDVRFVLEGMLRAMDRQKRPGEDDRAVSLRGLSWIVNPYEEGGVVIAIEITVGAVIAGPLDIDQAALEAMITRVLAAPSGPESTAVH